MREREGREPEIAGARGSFEIEDILKKLRDMEAETGRNLIPVNPMAVCGRDHAISAYKHSSRAFYRGTSVAKDFSAEFFRYLTGERQVSKAIEKGGIQEGEEMVIVSEISADRVISLLGLQRDDSLMECNPEKMMHLGIESTGIKGEEMALELVAMVAIL